MLKRMVIPVVLLAVAGLSACATTGTGSSSGRRTDVITAEEIAQQDGLRTAYDVIRRLRPQFLRRRGVASLSASSDDIVVYLDGIRTGGVEVLRNIDAATVREIRRINSRDATTKYGTGHSQGAIEVVTR